MAEPVAPCLPVGAERRTVMRVFGLGVGIGVGGAALLYGVCVVSMPLLAMLAFAAGVGLSTTMLTMALLSTCMDSAVAWRWRRTVRRHGLDESVAARALSDVRDALVPQELPESAGMGRDGE